MNYSSLIFYIGNVSIILCNKGIDDIIIIIAGIATSVDQAIFIGDLQVPKRLFFLNMSNFIIMVSS